MADYVLQVNYEQGADPVLVTLRGVSPDEAETAHQALETELEHARSMNAPVVFSGATDADPTAGVAIDPARVTGVNLIAPLG